MKITFGPNDYIEIVGSGENCELTKWGLDVCKFALERRIELEKAKPETPDTGKTQTDPVSPQEPVTESITEDITDDSYEIDPRCKDELMEVFYESPFYGILKEIMRSDKMDKVKCKVTINEQTAYIPVIDFNTGIRVICIDSEIIDKFKIPLVLIDRKIPFPFRIPKSGVKTRIIYSDICHESPMVTALSLKKLIIG